MSSYGLDTTSKSIKASAHIDAPKRDPEFEGVMSARVHNLERKCSGVASVDRTTLRFDELP